MVGQSEPKPAQAMMMSEQRGDDVSHEVEVWDFGTPLSRRPAVRSRSPSAATSSPRQWRDRARGLDCGQLASSGIGPPQSGRPLTTV
jgi:hypothetical protein